MMHVPQAALFAAVAVCKHHFAAMPAAMPATMPETMPAAMPASIPSQQCLRQASLLQ